MIQPQANVISATTGADGYYDVATSNGSVVSAVSILRATMTAGQPVTVIQCGEEYGIVALDKGLRSTLAVPDGYRSSAEADGPASVALSSIGRWSSLVQRVYVLGQVVSVGTASLVVDLLDGPFQGQRITTSVDTLLGISASDFTADDNIVLRAWPDVIPTVIGWWEASQPIYFALFAQYAPDAYTQITVCRVMEGITFSSGGYDEIKKVDFSLPVSYGVYVEKVGSVWKATGTGATSGKTMLIGASATVPQSDYTWIAFSTSPIYEALRSQMEASFRIGPSNVFEGPMGTPIEIRYALFLCVCGTRIEIDSIKGVKGSGVSPTQTPTTLGF